MRTLKKLAKNVIVDFFISIPLSVFVAFLVWFAVQVIIKANLGGFLNTWRWSYIILLGTLLIADLIITLSYLRKLSKFAKKNGLLLKDVEIAWWDFKFYKKYPDMLKLWNAEKFQGFYSREILIHEIAEALTSG